MSDSIVQTLFPEDQKHFWHTNAMFICRQDPDYTFVKVNSVCLKLLGYTRKELLLRYANQAMKLIHPEDREKSRCSVAKAAENAGERVFKVNLRINSKKNSYYMVEFIGRLYEENGEKLIAVAVGSGIRQMHVVSEMQSFEDFIHKVQNLTEDNFFEYDIINDIMVCSGMFTERFELPQVINNFSSLIRTGALVDDVSRLDVSSKQLFLTNGETVSKKIKLNDNKNNSYWYMVHYRVYSDDSGRPIKAIGKMNDITPQQNEIEALTKLSETDHLTGLYNRVSAEHLIKESLQNRRGGDGTGHTLMIIDIDNFKEVNDSIGHMYGDTVLTLLSDSLKEIFRSNDIIGRLGGDEFFVFIKNCDDNEVIAEKAEEVCTAFRNTYSEMGAPVKISASVGIAKMPEHGVDFETLYGCADIALYNIKAKGKDGFAIFDQNMGKTTYVSNRTELDSEKSTMLSLNHSLLDVIFMMLRECKDISVMLPAVLKLLVDKFNFSKGQIYELDASKSMLTKTFSWDNTAIFGENNIPDTRSYEEMKNLVKILLKDKIFIMNQINDIAKGTEREMVVAAEVKSMLAYPIISKGEFCGFISFLDTERERSFEMNMVENLESISGIISTFIMNLRLEEMIKNNI